MTIFLFFFLSNVAHIHLKDVLISIMKGHMCFLGHLHPDRTSPPGILYLVGGAIVSPEPDLYHLMIPNDNFPHCLIETLGTNWLGWQSAERFQSLVPVAP